MRNIYSKLRYRTICSLLFIGITSVSLYAQKAEIDLAQRFQTIEGFGASDCWTIQYVGKYWNETEKEKAARRLFSKEHDINGNPEGIGLSIWRFNIGGGTIEQGDSSHLNTDITRRAECFINSKGKYDWSKQAGQQWFLKKAKEYGCESFVAFANTPPVYYTRNGKGYAMADGNSNLKPDKYKDFARFLVKVVKHFDKQGIHFDYISPANEPQWDWTATYQEGCPWQNDELQRLFIILDKQIQKSKLNTRLMITEAGSWENLYEERKRASDQIEVFFNPNSPLYIGNLSTLPAALAGHSYWTDQNHNTLKDVRLKAKQKADLYGLKLHQTEWSLLSPTPLEGLEDYSKASYMDIALYMTKVIYADLMYAEVCSWSFWTSMDIELWGFKDRFSLLRLETPKGDVNSIVNGGKVSDMKTLWALGQYSRFIRPGYTRIGLTGCEDLGGVFASGYLSPDGHHLAVVFSNISNKEVLIPVTLLNSNKKIDIAHSQMYVTDHEHNMQLKNEYLQENNITLLPKSVSTVVYSLK